ncbi:MAG TPA: hypothetical protein VFU49_11110 [Ktedonobacteraceae bacterium]|nr:hypothetical protein [Ktedonobacteraceae bacterium]
MQQVASRPQPDHRGTGGSTAPQAILIIAILMFALSGLLIGFAVGAFAHPASPRVTASKQNGPTRLVQSPTPTQPPAIQAVPLGCPEIEKTSSVFTTAAQVADGTTNYTLSTQVKDKSAGTCSPNNKPVQAPGILCKLWLVPRVPDGQILLFPKDDARLKRGDLTAPLTGTIQNTDFAEVPGLQFDQTTPQVQQCDAQGHGSWNYTLAPTVPAGNYDLIVLTDWSSGRYFNWTWVNVTIKASQAH